MCRCLLRWFFYICLVGLALIFLPGLPPFGVEFTVKEFHKLPLEGPFEKNSRLNDVEVLNKEVLYSDVGYIRVNLPTMKEGVPK